MATPFPSIYLNFQLNSENLVTKLAHGDFTAVVDQLTKEGGSEKDATYGFAWGGHDKEVETLIVNKDLIPFAVAGYCRGGFNDKANFLIASYPDIEEKTKMHAVYGHAQAGNSGQVLSALRSSSKYLLMAILGAASTNQKELLMGLLNGTIYYPDAIEEAAKNGQFTLVQDLFFELGINYQQPINTVDKNSIEKLKFLNKALSGYIKGSHFAQAGHLINLGANPSYAVHQLVHDDTIKTEDAIILLAHINDDNDRQTVLSIILNTDLNLKADSFDIEEIKLIHSAIIKGSNYFAAQKGIKNINIPAEADLEGFITISMLEKLLMQNNECTNQNKII